MNSKTQTSNDRNPIFRILAILGIIVAVIIIAWLTVKVVNVVPNAFSSLASLAESLRDQTADTNNEDPTVLLLNNSATEIISGEELTISWNNNDAVGSYSFKFKCAEGIDVSIVNDSEVKPLVCDTSYDLGKVASITLLITSTGEEYEDLSYTIAFTPEDEGVVEALGDSTVVIINPDVSVVIDEDNEEEEEENEDVSEPDPEPTPEPEIVYEYTYEIPVSDPNGSTDLAISYLDVGRIINGDFEAEDLEEDSKGAIQFTVLNEGTKTSEEWSFEIELPDGSTYRSEDQFPLKPNERSVLTLGFHIDNDSRHTFEAELDTDRDTNSSNNRFSETVSIED